MVKRLLVILLKAAITVGLVVLFLHRVEWQELRSSFASVRVGPWGAAVGLFLLSNLLGAFQWRELLVRQGIGLPTGKVISLYFVGVFFNNFLVSNIGGDAVRIYDLNRMTGRGLAGFAATFLDRFIGLFVLICFAIVTYPFAPELWGATVWVPILGLSLGLLGVLCFGFSRRLSGSILAGVERILPARVGGFLRDVREAFGLYRYAYGVLARVAAFAIGVQLCRIGCFYAAGEALGQDVAFRHYVVFIPLIAIASAVPISFGGIGVRENMGVLLFSRVGMSAASAVAVMFLGYVSFIVASLAGGVLFVTRRVDRGTVPETEGPPEA